MVGVRDDPNYDLGEFRLIRVLIHLKASARVLLPPPE